MLLEINNQDRRPKGFRLFNAMNYKNKRWKILRERRLKKDGYLCAECRRYGKHVDATVVHHVYPAEDHPEWRYKLWNLISLCPQCHDKMHDRITKKLTAPGIDLQKRTPPPPEE